MPRDLQVHPIVSFLGSEEGINQVIVPEVYSPSDSINVRSDKYGRLRRILGAEVLSPPLLSEINAAPTFSLGLFSYHQGSAATGQLILAIDDGNDVELWRASSPFTSWTFIDDIVGAASFFPVDFAQYGTTLFITAAGAAVKKWDGTTLSNAGLTQSPQPTATPSAAGTNLNGTYRWKLVSMIGDVRQQGSLASTADQFENEQCALSWTADANTNVTGYELYRTTGTGGFFYFVAAIDGRTTVAYTDNTADRVILANRALTEQGDAPPSGAVYVEMHKERAWFARTGAFPYRAWWSDAGRPESVGTLNYLDFEGEAGGQPLVGMTAPYEGKIVFWTESGIWTVSGTGAIIDGVVDFYKRQTASGVGAVSHRTVLAIPVGSVYRDSTGSVRKTEKVVLAFQSSLGDIRIFNGETDTLISSPIETPTTITPFSHALNDEVHGLAIWWMLNDAATEVGVCIVWDYRHGVMTKWDVFPATASAVVTPALGSPYTVVGSGLARYLANQGAIVSKILTGHVTAEGDPIQARWASNTIYGRLGEDTKGAEMPLPAFHLTKRLRWAEVVMETNPLVIAEVGAYRANQAADGSQPAFSEKQVVLDDTTKRSTQQKVQLVDATGRFMHDDGIRLSVQDDLLSYEYLTPGVHSFVSPFTGDAIVECVGAGGGAGTTGTNAGPGGGGGAYARSTVPLTEGQAVTITVGQGGAVGANGTASSFGATVIAAPGSAGSGTVGGAGGTVAASTGTLEYAGGAGGAGSAGSGDSGGGGGGAAGRLGAGLAGGASAAVIGGPGGLGRLPGQRGGAGGNENLVGNPGTYPGGGGGGAGGGQASDTEGIGANGYVRVVFPGSDWAVEGIAVAYNSLSGTKRKRGG